jgi:uncharacterized protein YfaS (alpha-2-macroglobulin family)
MRTLGFALALIACAAFTVGTVFALAARENGRAQTTLVADDTLTKADKAFEDKLYLEAADLYQDLLQRGPGGKYHHCVMRLFVSLAEASAHERFEKTREDTKHEEKLSDENAAGFYRLLADYYARREHSFHTKEGKPRLYSVEFKKLTREEKWEWRDVDQTKADVKLAHGYAQKALDLLNALTPQKPADQRKQANKVLLAATLEYCDLCELNDRINGPNTVNSACFFGPDSVEPALETPDRVIEEPTDGDDEEEPVAPRTRPEAPTPAGPSEEPFTQRGWYYEPTYPSLPAINANFLLAERMAKDTGEAEIESLVAYRRASFCITAGLYGSAALNAKLANWRDPQVAAPEPLLDPRPHLNRIVRDFPKSEYADEARFLLGYVAYYLNDFAAARTEFAVLQKDSPKSKFIGEARRLLDVVEFPQCFTTLSATGAFIGVGDYASINVYCRNIERVNMTLREVDLAKLLDGADPGEFLFTEMAALEKLPTWEKAQGRVVFEQGYTPDPSRKNFYSVMDDIPLYTSRAGVYVLEVKAGPITERKLIQVANMAVSRRRDIAREQMWLTTRDGNPLEGVNLRGSYIENTYFNVPFKVNEPVDAKDPSKGTHEVTRISYERRLFTSAFSGRSDARGLIALEIPPRGVSNCWASVVLNGVTYLINDFGSPLRIDERAPWETAPSAPGVRDLRCFVYSDRPVYRPGDVCRLRIIGRSTSRDLKGERIGLMLRAEGVEQFRGEAVLNEFGAATLEFTIPPGAPLTDWEILALNEHIDGQSRFTLKVLEYVKRDIALKIDSPEATLVPGSDVNVPVTLSFLSGGPVADAAVNFNVNAIAMGGKGINVVAGSATTNAEGQVLIKLDTGSISEALEGRAITLNISADAIGPGGQRVTANAEARISGKGVTVSAEWPKANWLEGREVAVKLQVKDAAGRGVNVSGHVRYYQILGVSGLRPGNWRNPALRLAQQVEFNSYPGAELRLALPTGGRWRIEFEGHTENEEQVRLSHDLLVVQGATMADWGFEVVPEFDSYDCTQPVRILVGNPAGGTVLCGLFKNREGGEERIWPQIANFTIQTLEISERHAPWINVDLRRVREAALETASCGLRVEPISRRVNVKVNFDKEKYLPGETATADVFTFNHKGEPVSAEVCLSVWDSALKEFAQSALDGKDLFAHFNAAMTSEGVTASDELISENTRVAPSRKSTAQVKRWKIYEMPRGSFFYGALSWISTRQASFAQLYASDDSGPITMTATFYDSPTTGSDDNNESPTEDPKIEEDPYYGPNESPSPNMGGGGGGGGKGGFAYRRARGGGGRAGGKEADAKVRENFKDSAYFGVTRTNEKGVGQFAFTLPDNLTQWTFEATATDKAAGVGLASGAFTVAKLLMVRLVGPRGLTEGDEIEITGLVQNQSGEALDVTLDLALNTDSIAAAKLELVSASAPAKLNLNNGAIDKAVWRVRVKGYGSATLTLKGEAGELSDTLVWKYAVEPRGVQVVSVQRFEFDPNESQLELSPDLPAGLIADRSTLTVQMDSGLLASCIDALPHLVNYPYGCVEQTMNRFVPLLDALDLLRTQKLSLYDISKQRSQYGSAVSGNWPDELSDRSKVQDMLSSGFGRLRHYQHRDGGWGWWENDESQLHNSAVVLAGLARARILTRQEGDLALPASDAAIDYILQRGCHYVLEAAARESDAGLRNRGLCSVALALTLMPAGTKEQPQPADEMRETLVRMLRVARGSDGAIAAATLALALWHSGNARDAKTAVRDLAKLGEDAGDDGVVFEGGEEQTRWHATPLESQGFAVEAFALIDPENPMLAKALKNLTSRRVDGWWGDTRSTGVAVAAIARYLKARGENGADVSVDIAFGNAALGTFTTTKKEPVANRTRFELSGSAFAQNAEGEVKLKRRGNAPVSGTITVRGLIPLEDNTGDVKNGLSLSRSYYKRVSVTHEVHVEVQDQRGRVIRRYKEMRTEYDNEPLKPGDALKVGDILTVRLWLRDAKGKRYIAISDPRPSCIEPISEESKAFTREDRDTRTLFFLPQVKDDTVLLEYSAVVTCNGKFTALPALAFDMYAEDTWGRTAPTQIGK